MTHVAPVGAPNSDFSKLEICIVGEIVFHLPKYVGWGFQELGHRVTVFEPGSVESFQNKVRAFWSRQPLSDTVMLPWKKNIFSWRPKRPLDLVVFIKGGRSHLDKEMVERILELWAPKWKVLWLFDPLECIPQIFTYLEEIDFIFSYQKKDSELLTAQGHPCTYLPAAHASQIFSPLTRHKDLDLLFVGNFLRNPYRMELLLHLAEAARRHQWNVQYAGHIFRWYRPATKKKHATILNKLDSFLLNKMIDPHELNIYYNRTKVCLNIHDAPERGSWNPRSFNILGAGGCQLVDYRTDDPDLLRTGVHLESYRNPQELVEKVEWLLKTAQERKRLAEAGHKEARSRHTYRQRAETILRSLSEL